MPKGKNESRRKSEEDEDWKESDYLRQLMEDFELSRESTIGDLLDALINDEDELEHEED